MSTQSTAGSSEKGELRTESIQQTQGVDLASRGTTSLVQLRPVKGFANISHGTISAKTTVGSSTPTSIISVNRTGQGLTILPARTATPATYQIRAGNLAGQPASITVTPISGSSFGTTNIRLATPTNNGSWIQTGGAGTTTFTPIRASFVAGTRSIRPDGKMIHIPQQGTVTQLQMVDNKASIFKPSIGSSIVGIRGTGSNSGVSSGITVPLTPAITFRAANLTNLSTIQQRPPSNSTTATQKLITQPTHGQPIQLVNTKLPHSIQTLTPISRLNTVCLTLSTNGKGALAPNNTSPVVAVASRAGGPNLVMTPSTLTTGGLPMTKLYTVVSVREGPSLNDSGAVTVSTVSSVTGSNTTNVMLATVPSSTSSSQQQHQIVQVQGGTLTSIPGVAGGATSYFVDKNTVNLLQPHHQIRPISLEKRSDGKSLIGSTTMILTHSGGSSIAGQHVGFATLPTSGILTSGPSHHHTVLTTVSTPALTVTSTQAVPTTQSATGQNNNNNNTTSGGSISQILTHTIPTHVVSQPITVVSSSTAGLLSSSSSSGGLSQIPSSISTGSGGVNNSGSVVSINLSTLSGTSSTNNNNNTNVSSILIPTITTTATTSSLSSLTTNSGSSGGTNVTTASAVSTSTMNSLTTSSNPVQSPSSQNAKSTLSPRPSILRKREAAGGTVGDSHNIGPLRAQRNLTLNFSSASGSSTTTTSGNNNISNSNSGGNIIGVMAANKENAGGGGGSSSTIGQNIMTNSNLATTPDKSTCSSSNSGGVSILRKEFQPPNEESSWQSCSSNSSSGSTTISTTSETAELQLQQQQQQQQPNQQQDLSAAVSRSGLVTLGDLSSAVRSLSTIQNNNSVTTNGGGTSFIGSSSQNGMIRSAVSTVQQGRTHRNSSSGKAQLKDIERIKSKDKDDGVSPRKKPRKQQLTTSDLFSSGSPEISFYQGKRFKKGELMDSKLFEGFSDKGASTRQNEDHSLDEPSGSKIVYVLKKPQMSLLAWNRITTKPRQNHFQRYSDVKSKDDRRPTVTDLANQKNIGQKVHGWKLQRLGAQMSQVIELEVDVVTSFNEMLTTVESKVGPSNTDRDLTRMQELLKGNIQRCKVIRDQMSESRAQLSKILDHRPRMLEVINTFSKRTSVKKRTNL